MKQRVQILGMTCQNCRAGVEEKLATIQGVSSVSVSLEDAAANFETENLLSTVALEEVLGEKYTVNIFDEQNAVPDDHQLKVETIKTFISHFWLCNCWELPPCSISRASSFHAIFYGAVLHCFQFF